MCVCERERECVCVCLLQVGFEKQWLAVIQRYVVPVQEKVFPGYHSKVGVAFSGHMILM